jgi:hypothetical protein
MGARSTARQATAIIEPLAIVASDPAAAYDGPAAVSALCPDLDQWPANWMVEPRDLPPGRAMVDCFTPFFGHLLSAGLAGKTLRRHRDNLWLLGGELIRRLHEDPQLRKRAIADVVIAAIHHGEGPLTRGGTSELQQRSFDATCRKLHRFLIAHRATTR